MGIDCGGVVGIPILKLHDLPTVPSSCRVFTDKTGLLLIAIRVKPKADAQGQLVQEDVPKNKGISKVKSPLILPHLRTHDHQLAKKPILSETLGSIQSHLNTMVSIVR